MKKSMLITIMAILVLSFSAYVMAAGDNPAAPTTLEWQQTTRFNPLNYAPQNVSIVAGNITRLYIDTISQTRAWAGFYGNITGTITLDDANNYTFYNWSAAEPQGQIYATLSNNPSWTNVDCMDFSATNGDVNESIFEAYYGIETEDVDGLPETFNRTDHDAFTIAATEFTNCPTTYIWQNDQYQQDKFQNIMMADKSDDTSGWIFTTLIENNDANNATDVQCYNGEYCDFQILVADDGHDTNVAVTTYFIWVELI